MPFFTPYTEGGVFVKNTTLNNFIDSKNLKNYARNGSTKQN